MFKLQSKYKSMDINKNLEQYEFCPRQKNRTNYQKSFSEDKNLSLRDSIFNSNIKIRNNSNIPPIYFFRKVTNPYKYSITSIPEYLIKTNEEKRFVEKLYKSIDNDKEKTVLKNLLDKRNQNIKKDYYKPEVLDIHNVLRYKPKLYPVSFIPEAKIEKRPKNIKLMKKRVKKKKIQKIMIKKQKNQIHQKVILQRFYLNSIHQNHHQILLLIPIIFLLKVV